MSPLSTILLAAVGTAEAKTLQNDGFNEAKKQPVAFQGGFVTNECFASVFVPDEEDYPFEIEHVDVLIGGNTSQEIFIVQIYEVDALNTPTTRLAESAVAITGSQFYMSRVTFDDFKGELTIGSITQGNIAIAFCHYDHSGYPSIARDDDGLAYPDRSWIYDISGNWRQSSFYGLSGDWIMRLEIDAGVEVDTGDPGDDTGEPADTGEPGEDSAEPKDTEAPPKDSGGDGDSAVAELGLESITPSSTTEGEAVAVVLLGSGFEADTDARIGGISLTGLSVENDETISGKTPSALPAGVHDVEVVAEDGRYALLVDGFEVLSAEEEEVVEEEDGCGCASGTLGGLWLLPALWGLGRRRCPA